MWGWVRRLLLGPVVQGLSPDRAIYDEAMDVHRRLLEVKGDESDDAVDEVDWVEAGSRGGLLLHDLRRCGVVRSSGFLCPWLEEIPPGDVPGVGASFREISSYLQKAAFDNMARAAHKEDLVFSDRMVEKEDFE